jgi:hypothetical protein
MRYAVLVIALVVGLVSLVQACAVFGLSTTAEGLGSPNASDTTAAGAAGILTGMLILIGGGLAIPLPRASAIVLLLAGLIGIAVGASGQFPDQIVWGVIAIILAALAFIDSRRRRTMATAIPAANLAGAPAESEPTKVCPNCAETVKAAARQCRYCRHEFNP